MTTSLIGVIGRRRVGYIDLAARGCVLDGTTDDTAAFHAAVSYAATEGKELVFSGQLRVTNGLQLLGQSGGRPLRLRGDGPAVSKIIADIPATASQQGLLDLGGYGSLLTSSQALTVDALASTRTLTMADTSAFAAGDTLLLESTAAWDYTDKGAIRGELVRVGSKTATTITVTRPLDDNYLIAATARVRKVYVTEDALLDGFTITNARPGEGTASFIRLAGHRNATIRDLVLVGASGSGLVLNHAEDFLVDGVRFRDLSNDPANGRYGYGVLAYGSSRDGRVVNCHMRNGRHLFTTGADSGHPGVPRHILVANCEATEMDNACFDTHFEGEYIHHHNCHVYGTRAFGFQMRAANSIVSSCSVKSCGGAAFWLRAPRIRLTDVRVRDAKDASFDSDGTGVTTWPGQGVRVATGKSWTAEDSRLSGVEVRDTDQDAIYLADSGHELRAVSVRSPGRVSNSYGVRYATASSSGHLIDGLRVRDASNGIGVAAGVTGRQHRYEHRNVTTPGGLGADPNWTVAADV